MKYRYIASSMGSAALGVLLMLSSVAPAQNADSKAINELLKEAESHAMLASHDSETLESYTRSSGMSWQSHAQRLLTITDHANNLIEDFNKLSSMRSEGSPWQQEAIDRVDPLLKEMADHLKTTLAHFKENKLKVNMPTFRDYVEGNREYMGRTSELISSFVEYGETRAKANRLEASLNLSQSTELSKD